jgi:hypothetical protein
MKHVGRRTDPKDIASQEQLQARNRLINGAHTVSQRGTSLSGVTLSATYMTDRWHTFNFNNSGSFVLTLSQEEDAPAGTSFTKSLRATVTGTQANTSTTVAGLRQNIEGFDARALVGVDCTISFWVRSSVTGTYCINLVNSSGDRVYIAEYTVSVANTWERKAVAIPGGLITAGTWNWTNGVGVRVEWVLQCGSTMQGAANTWLTTNLRGTANQVNFYATAGNVFAITGAQFEPGAATPFEHLSYQQELARCQRYYYRATAADSTHIFGAAISISSTQAYVPVAFPVTMRDTPAAMDQTGVAANYAIGGSACNAVPTLHDLTGKDCGVALFSIASGIASAQVYWGRSNASVAYLGFSAEL